MKGKKPKLISQEEWDEEINHIKAKSELSESDNSIIIQYLYERLNIIDSKVSSLLTANTIFLAIISVLVTTRGQSLFEQISTGNAYLLKSSIVMCIASTVICLFVGLLKWEFLKDSTEESKKIYINTIIAVTTKRTLYYNLAVVLILFAAGIFFIVYFNL